MKPIFIWSLLAIALYLAAGNAAVIYMATHDLETTARGGIGLFSLFVGSGMAGYHLDKWRNG